MDSEGDRRRSLKGAVRDALDIATIPESEAASSRRRAGGFWTCHRGVLLMFHTERGGCMELKATRLEYRLEDESGYWFDVVAEHHPDRGWGATVTMKTGGFATAPDAIDRLTLAAQAFIRQAEQVKR